MSIKIFNHLIKKIPEHKNPVIFAWNMALDYLEFNESSEWREFGEKFASIHPDLIHSNNAYHNEIHTSEAIIASAILIKKELNEKELLFAPYLLFAMMCHDLMHNGKENKVKYELEKAAADSMNEYLTKGNFELYWNKNLRQNYGEFNHFKRIMKRIILGTEFHIGVKKNIERYENRKTIFDKLNMLANEADILVSSLPEYGLEKGKLLSIESNNENIGSENGRLYFLENLTNYHSKASKKLKIQEIIDKQIKSLKSKKLKFK